MITLRVECDHVCGNSFVVPGHELDIIGASTLRFGDGQASASVLLEANVAMPSGWHVEAADGAPGLVVYCPEHAPE